MERNIENLNILDKFCLDFIEVVEKHSEYIIVSGYVAISSGRTRGTEDIDMIIPRLSKERFVNLHSELGKDFVCIQSDDPHMIYDYLNDNVSVRYTRKDQPLPEMELKFSKDELDQYQLKTKTKLPLTGLDIWFSNINVNIAFKEHLLKSQKDMDDALHLRRVYDELVNESEIAKVRKLIDRCRL
ncbi:MAG: hypothetical protein ACLFP2_03015 [Candidatus Woesearchaeota archaeon]